ncbi:alpha-L-rhamnosidase [Ceratobasidium theobromae]|uniref:Alpha-L-rhamnosidase n=1 Tax=Ceratobasidium theobromae TaxID=1582974 RepID=A0A5N5QDR5_9AGAM|nr:alpha-L-rhamnosidase [Ceratobasidium theobromae]
MLGSTLTQVLACVWGLYFLETGVDAYVQPPKFLGQLPQPIVPYTFRPTKIHSVIGTVNNANALVQPSGPSERNGSFSTATLLPNSSVILDFGLNVGGYPVLDFGPVSNTSEKGATIRYTVSESLLALTPGVGDGSPLKGFAAALFRSEVIPVIPGGERWLGRAVQGGQRFLLIEHIGGAADVTLKEAGFEAATDVTPIENLPGSFNSSDKYLNALWAAGARTVQLGCTSKGSLAPAWQARVGDRDIDRFNEYCSSCKEPGSIFTFSKGIQLTPAPEYSQFHLRLGDNGTSTFSRDGGVSVNLPSGVLTTGKWHDLKFLVRGETNSSMSVSIDGVSIGTIPYDDASSVGPLGFTTGSDTTIIIKNLFVQDITGNTLYSNSLTSMSALADFSTGTNHYGVCFDGAKRDRTVWAGDFSIFGRTIVGPTRINICLALAPILDIYQFYSTHRNS